jgi:superfamily II DNA or RNA helicase
MIGSAENKLPTLRRLLQSRSDSSYNLVYCGDAVVDGERSVDATMALLGTDLGMRARKFTSDESLQERRTILEQFGTGELQVIAAIRCLDEGVDVPRTETAYILASSGDPRQYVQRRGRVLRRAPGKKFAYIYDFIVVPPLGKKQNDESFNLERKLVQKEFIRVNEFASAAENAGDALLELRPIRIRLNLLDT